MPSLLNLQSSFNGLTFGPGTDIQLTGITGLRSMPTRVADQSWPQRDGALPGIHLLAARTITYGLQVIAPQTATVEQLLASTAAAFMIIENPDGGLPLSVILPGWSEPRIITARPTNNDVPIDTNFVFGKVPIAVQFTCADPLIYSSTLHTASTGLPAPTAGLTFPVAFNVAFGASAGGSVAVSNAGNYNTPPLITITGPCINPYVTLGNFTFGVNISLTSTDVLVIDMANLSVTLNGVSRFNSIVGGSSWWTIPVGSSTVGFGSGDSSTVTATMTIQWRDAWGML